MALKIFTHNIKSFGARLLRDHLFELNDDGRTVFITNKPEVLNNHEVINWGSAKRINCQRLIGNDPRVVGLCINKVRFFDKLSINGMGDHIPEYTSEVAVVRRWFDEGSKVYCREVVNGSQGQGIVVASNERELVPAPLYTKRFKHAREYRAHFAFGTIIEVVEKKRRRGSDANALVRGNDDWVFARTLTKAIYSDEVNHIKQLAIDASRIIDLSFGAFDIAYSVSKEIGCIFECNTAPGLDNLSANKYAQALQRARVT